jgi:hypothetical protein
VDLGRAGALVYRPRTRHGTRSIRKQLAGTTRRTEKLLRLREKLLQQRERVEHEALILSDPASKTIVMAAAGKFVPTLP